MTTAPTLSLDTRLAGDVAHVVLVGTLEAATRSLLTAQVELAIAAHAQRVVLDLAACQRIDASGLGCLIACSKRVRGAGARLELAGLSAELRETLRLTRLDDLFVWPDASEPAPEVAHG